MRAASRVLAAEYDEMPTYSARPDRTAWSRAIMVSSIGVSGSKRCEILPATLPVLMRGGCVSAGQSRSRIRMAAKKPSTDQTASTT